MLKIVLTLIAFSGLLLVPAEAQNAFGDCFADAVITFNPLFSGGPAATTPLLMDPLTSLGPDDFDGTNHNSVSMGQGGLLELEFVDNILTNSGDITDDLIIYEIGADVERTFISIRPNAATAVLLGPAFDFNGDGFYEIGPSPGSTDGIDIDSSFPPVEAGVYVFNAVQIIDDFLQVVSNSPSTRGAEIDAVCGIDSGIIPTIVALGTPGEGSTTSQDPNLGDVRHGKGHENGFCMNQYCITVNGLFNHFPETTVPQGSTQSFTLLVNCPRGANTCNHIEIAGALPDSDFYEYQWSATVNRQPGTDNWVLTTNNQYGEIGEVTVTVQTVSQSYISATFNIPFLIPGSIGTHDGIGDPQKNNRHLHVTVWDDNGGMSNYIFNEGVYVDDIYAYPQVETSYEKPFEVEELCLNEDSTKRYTCAFDKVRDWTIKNAEKKLQEMNS